MSLHTYAIETYRLPNGESVTFTKDQIIAITDISSFLESEAHCFILKGYAGTGKTFLVRLLTHYHEHMHNQAALMAPTGRAALILQTKSGHLSSTIHSGIYNLEALQEEDLKTKDKEKNKKHKLVFKLNTSEDNINRNYIIDESSMISDKFSEGDFLQFGSGRLLKDLIQYISPQAPARKNKLIFIGDPAQLPPVTDNFSGALDADYLQQEYDISSKSYELTDVRRQEGKSGILEMATYVRNLLQIPKKERIVFELNTVSDDTHTIDLEDVVSTYKKLNPAMAPYKTVSIHYTNASCYDFNQMIRATYFDDVKQIQIGDLMVINKNLISDTQKIYNGTVCKVVQVSPQNDRKTNLFTRKKDGTKTTIDISFRDVVLEAYIAPNQKTVISCKIYEDLLFSPDAQLSYEANLAIYLDFKERMNKLDIKPGSDAFKQHLLSDHYANAAQVKFGYAITCHKAQGGEWENTIVNMDISQGINSDYFLRWIYTAITRASANIYLFNIPHKGQFDKFKYHQQLLAETPLSGDEIICTAPDNYDEILNRLRLDQAERFIAQKFNSIFAVAEHFGYHVQDRLDRKYLEQYTFAKDGASIGLKFNYNGQNKFTSIQIANNITTDAEAAALLKEEILKPRDIKFFDNSIIIVEDSNAPSSDYFTKEQAILKTLYNQINKNCLEQNIIIKNVEHNPYQERYFFVRHEEEAVINFSFNDQFQFGYSAPFIHQCNSNQLLKDLENIFEEELKQ